MYNKLKNKIYSGKRMIAFTLAETLIVVSIIGVIAAVSIPNVIYSYEKTQLTVRLKWLIHYLRQQ